MYIIINYGTEKKPFNKTQSYFTALCGIRYSLLILLTLDIRLKPIYIELWNVKGARALPSKIVESL